MGLVLGAGGVLGGAWLVGALHAIASEVGWDPGSADYIVGTSAGAMVGALVASGVPPWFLVVHSEGETFDGLTDARYEPSAPADGSGAAVGRFRQRGVELAPGSWRLGLAALTRPHKYSPMAIIAGWLPNGAVSTEPLKDLIRRVCPLGWSPHPNFWPVAVDYATGRRVTFGRPGSPPAQLPDAVAASCAIPGFYRNVEINGRVYVDGGVHSRSNLDLLQDERLDVVLALNPMSSPHLRPPRSLTQGFACAIRRAAGRRLEAEAERLRAAGTEVVVIQPTAEDLDAMGSNLMNSRGRPEVVQTAIRTMTRTLHTGSLGERLGELPRLVRRPAGPRQGHQPGWLDFKAAAHERWAEARAA